MGKCLMNTISSLTEPYVWSTLFYLNLMKSLPTSKALTAVTGINVSNFLLETPSHYPFSNQGTGGQTGCYRISAFFRLLAFCCLPPRSGAALLTESPDHVEPAHHRTWVADRPFINNSKLKMSFQLKIPAFDLQSLNHTRDRSLRIGCKVSDTTGIIHIFLLSVYGEALRSIESFSARLWRHPHHDMHARCRAVYQIEAMWQLSTVVPFVIVVFTFFSCVLINNTVYWLP